MNIEKRYKLWIFT